MSVENIFSEKKNAKPSSNENNFVRYTVSGTKSIRSTIINTFGPNAVTTNFFRVKYF